MCWLSFSTERAGTCRRGRAWTRPSWTPRRRSSSTRPSIWLSGRWVTAISSSPGLWIRIRIQIQEGKKWPTNLEKSKEFSRFEVLVVLFWGLKASPVQVSPSPQSCGSGSALIWVAGSGSRSRSSSTRPSIWPLGRWVTAFSSSSPPPRVVDPDPH